MAKQKKRQVKNNSFKKIWEKYKHEIVPAGIGAVITLIFSASIQLSLMVFLAVLVGSWVGHELLKK